MEAEWLGVAASAAGGGMFGVIGTFLGRVAGFFEARQQFEFEKARWQHDANMQRLSIEAEAAQADAELQRAGVEGSWSGLSESIRADAALASGFKWVEAIRALTRPALTLLLWLITALVFFNVDDSLKPRIVETAVFAATAATLWWFGDRSSPSGRRYPA